MSFWNTFPSKEELNKDMGSSIQAMDVNTHLHTPYSFSAFDSITQAVSMAKEENIAAIAINDFFTTDGYEEWAKVCADNKVFPLFNIEFIGLSESDQKNGVRINDPSNPGRIYMGGKGLSHPFKTDEASANMLSMLKENANAQVTAMCEALNKHLTNNGLNFQLAINEILDNYTKGLIRERHLAKALRLKVFELESTDELRKSLLGKICGAELKSDINNAAAVENELRGKLLKSGGPAFIAESPDSFPPLEKVIQFILNGGGIPTYPLLADSVNGGFTEYEEDKDKLLADLKSKGIYSVEFISNRNTTKVLEEYCQFFIDNGFLVTIGSEHNTPQLMQIALDTVDKEKLSDKLKQINYEGACIVAAHQYLFATTGKGFLNEDNKPKIGDKEQFIKLGDRLIQHLKN